MEVERMDLMFNVNDFLPHHIIYANQLYKHYLLSGLLAHKDLESGNYEGASKHLDSQQDDLHELIQLKTLKEKRKYQAEQKQLHELLRQRQISFSALRKNHK